MSESTTQAGIEELIARIRKSSAEGTSPEWQTAGACGAGAIKPLAELTLDGNFETQRAAKRALAQVVHTAGNPNTRRAAKQAVTALVELTQHANATVRRQAVWLLSEIATEESIRPMARLLNDPEVREDARCALLRMPPKAARAALQNAFKQANDDFKYALADSLRLLGEKVEGCPSRKGIPTGKTEVKPFTKA